MTTFRKRVLTGLVAIMLGAGSFAAYADKPGCGPGKEGRMSFEERAQRMEKRMTELHDKLKLNANQETAWKAYVARIKPEQRPQRPDRAEFEKLTTPERMERMLGFMQERQKRMAERVEATKSFYAVLTPEQQKIFDEQSRMGRGHHRHGKAG